MFRELVENHISNRGRIVSAGQIFPTPANHIRYCSLFMFGPDFETYVQTNLNAKGNPSVEGYKGKTYCEAVWIDIDYSENVDEARKSCIQLVRRLNSEYGIDPSLLFIFFSGGKGFHLAVLNRFIGFQNDTAIESEKVKDFVRRLTAGIAHIDMKIYEPVRLFRIENSQHDKTGLYKIRLSYDELLCELEDITNLAKQPRKFPYQPNYGLIALSERLQAVWINSGAYVQEQREFESKGNLFQPPKEGNRNNTLLVQACTLFRRSELSNNAIYDIVSNAAYIASIGSKEAITDQEVKRIVANAEKLVGNDRKKAEAEEIQVRSFSEWIPEWENDVLQERTNMSLVFSDLNQVMKGRLKGRMGVIMGYGGSKKSLYALNVCLRNLKGSDEVGIYSTMEMSIPRLMDRIIDHEVPVESGNASNVLAEIYRTNITEGRKFLMSELGKELGQKLQLTPNGRMTYEGYKKVIQKVKETAGVPAILVVDGLSMMGGKGTETEVYSRNSADLKELANEENILVLLICHVSKGAEKYTRDLSRYIRGSEKILDNCDFYMTMSQIQDMGNPEQFETDKGFISFHDKRNSGKTIDLVYGFDSSRLSLSDSPLNPKEYYEPLKSKGKNFQDGEF